MSKYHDILGISPDASQDEIKKAYHKLALSHHPDQGGDEEKFKEINEAYSILSGKQQAPMEQNPFEGGFPGFGFGFDISDLFKGGFNQQQTSQRPEPRPFNIVVSPEEIKEGRKYTANYSSVEDCSACSAQGGEGKRECARCNGRGSITYVSRQGNAVWQSTTPCSHCKGCGIMFDKVCDDCSGKGWIEHPKTINFEIKEIK